MAGKLFSALRRRAAKAAAAILETLVPDKPSAVFRFYLHWGKPPMVPMRCDALHAPGETVMPHIRLALRYR